MDGTKTCTIAIEIRVDEGVCLFRAAVFIAVAVIGVCIVVKKLLAAETNFSPMLMWGGEKVCARRALRSIYLPH